MTTQRPEWLTEQCPDWCEIDHAEQVLPGDRLHAECGITVPVIAEYTTRGHDGELLHHEEPAYMTVGRYRRVGEQTSWLSIGEDERQHLEISLESAHRLVGVLRDELGL
ncbi:hypothetical protein [Microbacterium sp. NPDC076895]|uniref:DUF6907 domain-containing protein n=1 Tax=Microbacterium sp. NPDC076895 TaxID=3154957 RepID=UPI00343601CB